MENSKSYFSTDQDLCNNAHNWHESRDGEDFIQLFILTENNDIYPVTIIASNPSSEFLNKVISIDVEKLLIEIGDFTEIRK